MLSHKGRPGSRVNLTIVIICAMIIGELGEVLVASLAGPESKVPKGEPLRVTQGCSIGLPAWMSLFVSPLPLPI